jgi:lipoyl-dependent peroxiredoxin
LRGSLHHIITLTGQALAKEATPKELIAAAYAGCFSMALSFMLEQAGYTPERIQTAARVFHVPSPRPWPA